MLWTALWLVCVAAARLCAGVNVSSGGQLFDALSRNATAVSLTRPIVFNPLRWRERPTDQLPRVYANTTVSTDNPHLVVDVTDVSGDRAWTPFYNRQAVLMEPGAVLTFSGALVFASDVPLATTDDLTTYLAFAVPNLNGSVVFDGVTLAAPPASNLSALAADITSQGGVVKPDATLPGSLLLVNGWRNGEGTLTLRAVTLVALKYARVTTGGDLRNALTQAESAYVQLDGRVSLADFGDPVTITQPYFLTPAGDGVVLDAAHQTALIAVAKGGALRLRGAFQLINAGVSSESGRTSEEALPAFVTVQTDGVATLELTTVYGAHQSPLLDPMRYLATVQAVCPAPTYLPTLTRPNNITIVVSRWTLDLGEVAFCTTDVQSTDEAFRRVANVTLVVGDPPSPGKKRPLWLVVALPIGGFIVLAAVLALLAVLRMLCRREGVALKSQELLVGLTAVSRDVLHQTVVFEKLLGFGSFGRVYMGTMGGEPVAVKIIQPARDAAQLKEAEVAQSLSHVNLVATTHFGVRTLPVVIDRFPSESLDDSDPAPAPLEERTKSPSLPTTLVEVWIVLEYCDGGTLHAALRNDRLMRDGWPDMHAVLLTALDICRGMVYLSGRKIVHGDLNCNNVLLKTQADDPRGFIVKVSDFGMSRFFNGTHHTTKAMGTVSHMPPELLLSGHLSGSTDVYAFGVVLWELFCGEVAYSKTHNAVIMHQVCVDNKRPELPSSVPEEYAALVQACWLRVPSDRPGWDAILFSLKGMLGRVQDLQTHVTHDRRRMSRTVSGPVNSSPP